MEQNTPAKKIKPFVQNILQCGCPDEVFELIEYSPDTTMDKILIGQKLLIYVIKTINIKNLDEVIQNLCISGIQERNKNLYNRFRLVILSNPDSNIANHIKSIFASIPGRDEKVHLHLIAKNLYIQ